MELESKNEIIKTIKEENESLIEKNKKWLAKLD